MRTVQKGARLSIRVPEIKLQTWMAIAAAEGMTLTDWITKVSDGAAAAALIGNTALLKRVANGRS